MIGIATVYAQSKSSKAIVIPKDIAEVIGLKAGDKLLVRLRDNEIVLKRIEEEVISPAR